MTRLRCQVRVTVKLIAFVGLLALLSEPAHAVTLSCLGTANHDSTHCVCEANGISAVDGAGTHKASPRPSRYHFKASHLWANWGWQTAPNFLSHVSWRAQSWYPHSRLTRDDWSSTLFEGEGGHRFIDDHRSWSESGFSLWPRGDRNPWRDGDHKPWSEHVYCPNPDPPTPVPLPGGLPLLVGGLGLIGWWARRQRHVGPANDGV